MEIFKSEDVNSFFQILNVSHIKYILIKNISKELPHKLSKKKDIDIIVHPDSKTDFQRTMKDNGFHRHPHPFGEECGWKFLYGMYPKIQYQHYKTKLLIDIEFQLCTKCLDMHAWLPLDKRIQKSIWKNRQWNKDFLWWQMDPSNQLVYLLTRSVFEKRGFLSPYINEIKMYYNLLQTDEVIEKLNMIFFKFTPVLIEMIKKEKYDEIICAYRSFSDY